MNCSDRSAVRRRGPRFLEEPANGGEQCGRLFNVWNVARTVHYDQGCFRREGRCLGRRERNGILATVDDERRNGHRSGAIHPRAGRNHRDFPRPFAARDR
jgi:hypothetical protein